MESFSSINTELTTLTSNIRMAQQAKLIEQKGKVCILFATFHSFNAQNIC